MRAARFGCVVGCEGGGIWVRRRLCATQNRPQFEVVSFKICVALTLDLGEGLEHIKLEVVRRRLLTVATAQQELVFELNCDPNGGAACLRACACVPACVCVRACGERNMGSY